MSTTYLNLKQDETYLSKKTKKKKKKLDLERSESSDQTSNTIKLKEEKKSKEKSKIENLNFKKAISQMDTKVGPAYSRIENLELSTSYLVRLLYYIAKEMNPKKKQEELKKAVKKYLFEKSAKKKETPTGYEIVIEYTKEEIKKEEEEEKKMIEEEKVENRLVVWNGKDVNIMQELDNIEKNLSLDNIKDQQEVINVYNNYMNNTEDKVKIRMQEVFEEILNEKILKIQDFMNKKINDIQKDEKINNIIINLIKPEEINENIQKLINNGKEELNQMIKEQTEDIKKNVELTKETTKKLDENNKKLIDSNVKQQELLENLISNIKNEEENFKNFKEQSILEVKSIINENKLTELENKINKNEQKNEYLNEERIKHNNMIYQLDNIIKGEMEMIKNRINIMETSMNFLSNIEKFRKESTGSFSKENTEILNKIINGQQIIEKNLQEINKEKIKKEINEEIGIQIKDILEKINRLENEKIINIIEKNENIKQMKLDLDQLRKEILEEKNKINLVELEKDTIKQKIKDIQESKLIKINNGGEDPPDRRYIERVVLDTIIEERKKSKENMLNKEKIKEWIGKEINEKISKINNEIWKNKMELENKIINLSNSKEMTKIDTKTGEQRMLGGDIHIFEPIRREEVKNYDIQIIKLENDIENFKKDIEKIKKKQDKVKSKQITIDENIKEIKDWKEKYKKNVKEIEDDNINFKKKLINLEELEINYKKINYRIENLESEKEIKFKNIESKNIELNNNIIEQKNTTGKILNNNLTIEKKINILNKKINEVEEKRNKRLEEIEKIVNEEINKNNKTFELVSKNYELLINNLIKIPKEPKKENEEEIKKLKQINNAQKEIVEDEKIKKKVNEELKSYNFKENIKTIIEEINTTKKESICNNENCNYCKEIKEQMENDNNEIWDKISKVEKIIEEKEKRKIIIKQEANNKKEKKIKEENNAIENKELNWRIKEEVVKEGKKIEKNLKDYIKVVYKQEQKEDNKENGKEFEKEQFEDIKNEIKDSVKKEIEEELNKEKENKSGINILKNKNKKVKINYESKNIRELDRELKINWLKENIDNKKKVIENTKKLLFKNLIEIIKKIYIKIENKREEKECKYLIGMQWEDQMIKFNKKSKKYIKYIIKKETILNEIGTLKKFKNKDLILMKDVNRNLLIYDVENNEKLIELCKYCMEKHNSKSCCNFFNIFNNLYINWKNLENRKSICPLCGMCHALNNSDNILKIRNCRIIQNIICMIIFCLIDYKNLITNQIKPINNSEEYNFNKIIWKNGKKFLKVEDWFKNFEEDIKNILDKIFKNLSINDENIVKCFIFKNKTKEDDIEDIQKEKNNNIWLRNVIGIEKLIKYCTKNIDSKLNEKIIEKIKKKYKENNNKKRRLNKMLYGTSIDKVYTNMSIVLFKFGKRFGIEQDKNKLDEFIFKKNKNYRNDKRNINIVDEIEGKLTKFQIREIYFNMIYIKIANKFNEINNKGYIITPVYNRFKNIYRDEFNRQLIVNKIKSKYYNKINEIKILVQELKQRSTKNKKEENWFKNKLRLVDEERNDKIEVKYIINRNYRNYEALWKNDIKYNEEEEKDEIVKEEEEEEYEEYEDEEEEEESDQNEEEVEEEEEEKEEEDNQKKDGEFKNKNKKEPRKENKNKEIENKELGVIKEENRSKEDSGGKSKNASNEKVSSDKENDEVKEENKKLENKRKRNNKEKDKDNLKQFEKEQKKNGKIETSSINTNTINDLLGNQDDEIIEEEDPNKLNKEEMNEEI